MSPTIMAIVFAMIVTLGFTLLRPTAPRDPRSPPVASSTIPLIGHIIGFLRHRGAYLGTISSKHPSWPIFTLEIFSTKVYVATSPDTIRSLYANSKALSFHPFTVAFSQRVLQLKKYVIDLMSANNSENPYMRAIHGAYNGLLPGPDLLQVNTSALDSLADELNTIGTSEQPKTLLQWMRTSYAISLSKAFYGPDNPILDNPSFIPLIWEFEESIPILFANVFPSILAPTAINAKKLLWPAFKEYYDKGLDKNATYFIKARAKAARDSGIRNVDMGAFEITILFASLTNAVPNAFSMLCNVFADPDLKAELCEEVAGVTTKTIIDGVTYMTIDTTAFTAKCPLLVAAWQETLRICVNVVSVRAVVEDVVTKDNFALQKGGVVQLAAGRTHLSEEIWGKDAKVFNARRFLDADNLTKEEKKARTLSPWGGGRHLCPGRHFAFTEVGGFVAMMVYGFEIEMQKGGGKVEVPPFRVQQVGENSRNPTHDIEVFIKRKEEFKDVRFRFNADPALSIVQKPVVGVE